jgi:hypothetical protein
MPKLIVAAMSSAIASSARRCACGVVPRSASVRLVRMAALPHAMSTPTPITATCSR